MKQALRSSALFFCSLYHSTLLVRSGSHFTHAATHHNRVRFLQSYSDKHDFALHAGSQPLQLTISAPWLNKAAEQLLAESDEFLNLAVWVAGALDLLIGACIAFIGSHLRLKPDPRVIMFPTMFGMMSVLPVSTYLLYQPLTLPLPTCLTFGHPVNFGGIWPNVCDPSNLALHPRGDGGWPCFPRELRTWLANVAGPDGWHYLVRPTEMMLAYLIIWTSTSVSSCS